MSKADKAPESAPDPLQLFIRQIHREQASGITNLASMKPRNDRKSIAHIYSRWEQFQGYSQPVYLEGNDGLYSPLPIDTILNDANFIKQQKFEYGNRTFTADKIHFDPLFQKHRTLINSLFRYGKAGDYILADNEHILPSEAAEQNNYEVYMKAYQSSSEELGMKAKFALSNGMQVISLLDSSTMQRCFLPALLDDRVVQLKHALSSLKTKEMQNLRVSKQLLQLGSSEPAYYSCAYFDAQGKHIPFYQGTLLRKWLRQSEKLGDGIGGDLWEVYLKKEKQIENRVARFLLLTQKKCTKAKPQWRDKLQKDGSLYVRCSRCSEQGPAHIWRYFSAIELHFGKKTLLCPLCGSCFLNQYEPQRELELINPFQDSDIDERPIHALAVQKVDAQLGQTFKGLFHMSEGRNHVFEWSTKLNNQSSNEPIRKYEKRKTATEIIEPFVHTGVLRWPQTIESFRVTTDYASNLSS